MEDGGPVDPAYMLKNFLQHRDKQYIELAAIKLTQLEDTKHGELIPLTSGSGRLYYKYIAEPDYLGNDKAVFMAEFEGKRYKVVVNFVISDGIDDYNPKCPESELIKLKKPPPVPPAMTWVPSPSPSPTSTAAPSA